MSGIFDNLFDPVVRTDSIVLLLC